jgi:MYXO-CTERM domain-containing protein
MRKFAFALAGLTLVAAGSAQGVVVYDANTTTGADGSFFSAAPGFAQAITLNVANAPVTVLSFTVFGIRWASNPGVNQLARISFYSGADETGGATDALAGAVLAGSITYTLTPQAAGSYNYTLPGVNITLPGNHVFVVAQFLNTAGTAYSTVLNGRYSTGIPATGTNDGFVYQDNGDGVFAGSERTQFNGATSGTPVPTNIRMTIDVPSPASAALLGLGGLVAFRRRRN